MRKFLLVLIGLFCVLALGCGGGLSKHGIKNEAKDFDAGKLSVRDEAINFNATYYEKGALEIKRECFESFLAVKNEYWKTHDDAKYKEEKKKLDTAECLKWIDFKKKLSQVKLENREVGALKIRLETLVDSKIHELGLYIFPSKYSEEAVAWQKRQASDSTSKSIFDYEDSYACLVDNKPLEVINSPEGPRIGAKRVSDILVGISLVVEEKEIFDEDYSRLTPKGKFFTVWLCVFNDSKDAVTIGVDNFKIVDKEGRKYSASSKAAAMSAKWLEEEKGVNIFREQLNPNMHMTTVLSFDMPAEAKQYDYMLQVSIGPKGENVKLPLRVIMAN